MSDHLESRMFGIRKIDDRSQSCAGYQLSKVKHKCNEVHNQHYNKQNNKDNEPESATAMYMGQMVHRHTSYKTNYKHGGTISRVKRLCQS